MIQISFTDRDLIGQQFPTASHLREYLESFPWPAA